MCVAPSNTPSPTHTPRTLVCGCCALSQTDGYPRVFHPSTSEIVSPSNIPSLTQLRVERRTRVHALTAPEDGPRVSVESQATTRQTATLAKVQILGSADPGLVTFGHDSVTNHQIMDMLERGDVIVE